MKVLKGILKESREYYEQTARKILRRLNSLPKGSVKKRKINARVYYYLQYRKGKKVVHKYLGGGNPSAIMRKLNERRQLEEELKSVRKSLKLLKKLKSGKRKNKA